MQDVLYLALELSKKNWKLGFCISKQVKVIDVPSGDWEALQQAVKRAKQMFGVAADTKVVSCYEAGRDGFWIHRGLLERGIENQVIDSASIEVSRRKRQAKTDSIDVRSLLRLLKRYHAGDDDAYRVAEVPSPQDEDDRHLHRELEALKGSRTSISNQLKSLLVLYGVHIENIGDLGGGIPTVDGNGEPLMPNLRSRLKRAWEHYKLVDDQIADLHAQQQREVKEEANEKTGMVKSLTALKGIGIISAWTLAMEVFGWRQFRNRKQAGAYPGFTPTPFSSGDLSREQGISKAGNARIRWLMVELSWLWLRWQPNSRISKWFRSRCPDGASKRMRRVSIVGVARRLFIALWRYVTQGIVPEGAIMSV